MKAIFWTRQEVGHLQQSDWRETNLAKAIQNGARLHGDEVEILAVPDDGQPKVIDCDLVLKIGVKSRNWFRAYNEAGIPYCYFDKGYIRTRASEWLEYWRVSVNGHQPLKYIEAALNSDARAKAMGLALQPRKTGGQCIIADGSSGKHCYFHAEQDFKGKAELDTLANSIASKLVADIQKISKRHIVYRPKPSWKGARKIDGVEYARGRPGVGDKDSAYDLRRAHAVVTYGSNLCFDAVCFGVPAIVLGEGIARPVSSTSLDDLENPYWAPDDQRQQWLNNCAWCQFKVKEFTDGTAWPVIRDMVEVSK